MTLCGLVEGYQCFGGTYFLHLQDWSHELSALLAVRLTYSSTLKLKAFKLLRNVGRLLSLHPPEELSSSNIKEIWNFVGFGFLLALTMKCAILWAGTPCSLDGLWIWRRHDPSKRLAVSELQDVAIEIWNFVWFSEHLKMRSEDSGGHRRPMKWFSGLSNLDKTNVLMATFSKKSHRNRQTDMVIK
jgi:hypothetical protein